ncbi:MAG TPA: 2-dehydropantoate 2-reductase N-terminal domain-containing protein [Trebonia sp.]|nr:2-dehydropantoate 2-reductase N-terminal domain-containing protein [Trebonia sp.]
MSAPTSPLSVAVIGAGRIGSAFAYQLRRAGHDVTVVARPGSRRLAQLQRDRGIVLTAGERASVTVADHLDEQEPFDLVIVTTLAHQVDALLPALQRSQARCVHFMFVTPEAERLRSAVGARRATFGMAAVLATLDSDGRLGLTIPKAKAMQGDQRWVDLFQAAGMPSTLERDMGRWLRSQTRLTIAMEGVAVAGMRHKRGATWAEAKTGARGLRAGFSILRELGETPYPGSKNQISRAPRFVLTLILWGVSRSRYRETVGNSAEECRGLIDLLAAEGGQSPALRKAVDAVLALRPADTAQVGVPSA